MEPGRLTEYRDWTIGISNEEMMSEMDDPRHWDNLGTMICFHHNYSLGDEHEWDVHDFKSYVDRGTRTGTLMALPLYLYDHSGITMSTVPFSCPWDSGQVGWIYVEKKDVLKEYNWKVLTAERHAEVVRLLRSEVTIYDQHLRGEVYYYAINDPEGELYDCCGGYYDTPDEIIAMCKESIDDEINQRSVKATARAIHTQREALLHTVR